LSPAAAGISSRHTPTTAHSSTKPLLRAASSDSGTMIPSKKVSSQDDCPLFKLSAELRNKIYFLVFAIETNENDDSIELNEITAAPSKALVMTCQVIRSETQAMYKAAYRRFPCHDFTLDVSERRAIPSVPPFSDDIFSRINTIHVTWQSDTLEEDSPVRFITHFNRNHERQRWDIRVEFRDEYGKSAENARVIISYFEHLGFLRLEASAVFSQASSGSTLSFEFSSRVYSVIVEHVSEPYLLLVRRGQDS
jgi:hypothetical protein